MQPIEVKQEGVSWFRFTNEAKIPVTPQNIESFYDSLQGENLELFTRIANNLPCPKAYVQENAETFGWNEALIARGSFFTPRRLSRPVPYFKKSFHCYENSMTYAKRKGLLYVEGIGINPAGAQIHAWNSTDGTDVLDYTWPYQHLNKYFGIVFDPAWLKSKGYSYGILGYLAREVNEFGSKKARKALLSLEPRSA